MGKTDKKEQVEKCIIKRIVHLAGKKFGFSHCRGTVNCLPAVAY